MLSLDLGLLIGAGVVLLAIAAARLGSRLGLPALLLFLMLGMVLGSSGPAASFSDALLTHDIGFIA